MLVREAISFQRYRDPKTALGFHEDFDSSHDAARYVNDHFFEITGFKKMVNDPKDDDLMHPKIFKKLEKWYNEHKQFIEEENEEDFWDGFVDWDACRHTIKESISFQRYKDPKDALLGKRPELTIGDFGQDYNGTIVKVEEILTKQQVLEGDYEMFDSLDNYSNSDLFYATVTMKDNPDVPATKGEQGIYPAEYDYKTYWGLYKIERSLVPKSLRETVSFQRYKDPKEALGLKPKTFHADEIRFYKDREQNHLYSSAKVMFSCKKMYLEKQGIDIIKNIIKLFKETSSENIMVEKKRRTDSIHNFSLYMLEELYNKGYSYIEFKGLLFDITEKFD